MTPRSCARMALACLEREYPRVDRLWLEADSDLLPARRRTPVFYGCLDWHSAVHGHWQLARVARTDPATASALDIPAVLQRRLDPDALAVEADHLRRRQRFECPYGLVWLLALHAELAAWPDAAVPADVLEAPVSAATDNLRRWLDTLPRPDRTGTHGQTAFALGLLHDWALATGEDDLRRLIGDRAGAFFGDDRDWPLHLEPLAHDFLSPALAEADLMRRLLPAADFADWLDAFLPGLAHADGLPHPAGPQDTADYQQAHWTGLNLSRAWMLQDIATHLPPPDPRRARLRRAADRHGAAGLARIDPDAYAGSHWLGTFAVRWLTREEATPSPRPAGP